MSAYKRLFGTVRGPVVPGDGGAHVAVGGMVRLLSEVRLTIIAIAVVLGQIETGIDVSQAVVVLTVLPFSFVPARSWDRWGALFSRSGILLACDLIATCILVAVLPSDLLLVYVAATVALLGLIVGWRLALFMAVPLVLVIAATRWTETSPVVAWAVVAGGVLALAAMAWAGDSLGAALRRQSVVSYELAQSRARRERTLERVRIARDLHDTVAGDLAGATMLAGALVSRLVKDGVQGRSLALAQQLEETCLLAHSHTRIALGELRRAEVAPVDDLNDVCERWSQRTGTPCTADIDPAFGDESLEMSTDIRAILLELLENVRRHADADRVQVRLTVDEAVVRLSVADDGRGLTDPSPAGDAAVHGDEHFGLRGIDERAAKYEGAVSRTAAPGGGLLTTVTLPRGGSWAEHAVTEERTKLP